MDGTNEDPNDLARNTSIFQPAVDENSTVIIGAGIIGCATAYYLSQNPDVRPDTIHLVEAAPELFASASGKAAGFCAPDWFAPPTASLGELSFRLHQELAAEHRGREKWGYSRSTGTSFTEGRGSASFSNDWMKDGASRAEIASKHEFVGEEAGPTWLMRREGDRVEVLSEEGGVAQVDPLRLSQFLLRTSLRRGVRFHNPATPIRLQRDSQNKLSGLRLRHTGSGADFKIPCTRLVIAAGAWSTRVFETLFPTSGLELGVSGFAGYSIVVRSPRWEGEDTTPAPPSSSSPETAAGDRACHAVFTTSPSGFSPELFSRLNGEIYLAGLNDASLPLPSLPTTSPPDPAKLQQLKTTASRLLGRDNEPELDVLKEGLCFRPVTDSGQPVVARLDEEELGGLGTRGGREGGVFVAAGHGPWGISLGLGTGLVVAEMVEGMEMAGLSADLGGLGV